MPPVAAALSGRTPRWHNFAPDTLEEVSGSIATLSGAEAPDMSSVPFLCLLLVPVLVLAQLVPHVVSVGTGRAGSTADT
jgi:hypothetical protein